MKGDIAAETVVRSTILAKSILNGMDVVRRLLSNSPEIQGALCHLRDTFVAKLLTGDGTLDVRVADNRLYATIRIVDANENYLKDYQRILMNMGFRARLIARRRTVSAYCSWENLLQLYRIKAFNGSRNWRKLLCALAIAIKGREIRGYERLRQLSKQRTFISDNIADTYRISRRSANLWIHHMRRLRMITRVNKFHGGQFIRYRLTRQAINIVQLLDQWEREFANLCYATQHHEPEKILQSIKIRTANRGVQKTGKSPFHGIPALK
jgi:hypothetical protein